MEQAICEYCGKPFDRDPRIYWRKWCSNACRQKAARERKLKAQEKAKTS